METGKESESSGHAEWSAADFISANMQAILRDTAQYKNIKTDYSKDEGFRGGPLSPEKEVETRFTYVPPRGDQTVRYVVIRAIAKELGRAINRWCPPSRERELALTALDQVVMWANAAIARREE